MNKISDKILERLLGAVTSLIVALITFLFFSYFSSFATKAEVFKVENRLDKKINSVEHSIDKVLSGLCIIDQRTCKLKEK
jgi:sensor domain CHASE-containing protein